MIDRRYESGKSFVMYSKEELEAARRTAHRRIRIG